MRTERITYVDVLLPVAVPNLYTYHLGDAIDPEQIKPGMRVCVQFGKRKLHTGLVINIHHTAPEEYQTKEIVALLDDYPVIRSWQIKFWNWIAEYYMCTRGEVFTAAMPSGLRPEGQTRLYLEELPEQGIKLTGLEESVYAVLVNNPGITIEELQKQLDGRQLMPVLRDLQKKNLLSFEELLKDAVKAKEVELLQLHKNLQFEKVVAEILNKTERRAPKQNDVILSYLQLCGFVRNKEFNPVRKQELLKMSKATSATVKSLVDKEIFTVSKEEVSRLVRKSAVNKLASLNPNQQKAYQQIKESYTKHDVTLLHGVTSSGKTEIYIHLIEEQLKLGKQVLYLLPEIALTTQIIRRLQNVFGDQVGVYHSKFNNAERVEIWNNLLGIRTKDSADYKIILGVRSSLFLPFDNLGLVIVDEEHENSYKQFDPAPRYHARDAAIVLASIHKAKILLGTATPSLESYFNVKIGKYALVELFQRHLDLKLPAIEVVNIKEARRKKKLVAHFTPELVEEVRLALEKKEQVILFQNRRGFAPYLECRECAWIPGCQHCDVSLTYHKGINKLICHYCGFSVSSVVQCKACGSTNLEHRGIGTEKIEDDLQKLFPEAVIGRLDLDSTRKKNAYESIIDRFESGEINVLIGTQMISKGLDFDNVSIVGIINADNMLNYPDFRAFERSFQLMSQVSGRAGRKNKQGKVVIQTSDPSNPIIDQVVNTDYTAFFKEQIQERKLYKYPPYYRLINLTIRHKQQDILNKASWMLAKELQGYFGNRILGPEAPVVGRIQNWHIKKILIKLEKTLEIKEHKNKINEIILNIKSQDGFASLQIFPDVDVF